MSGLTISDVVRRTGVAEGTLRMWERRHGFPVPQRLPSGHRRYSEEQVARVLRVVAARAAGLSLAAAIARARRDEETSLNSVYAGIRRRRPDVEPRTIPKRLLEALTHAIEDESLSRAEMPILFASFQRDRFYRQARDRWIELSRGAALAVVFAEFSHPRVVAGAPAEIAMPRAHPMTREWAIVCDAARHGVCLAAREPPASSPDQPSVERRFETIWGVEPDVVRQAARICADIAAPASPHLLDPVRDRLDAEAEAPAEDQLRLSTAITNRALSYLA